jgi:hypothetical protein
MLVFSRFIIYNVSMSITDIFNKIKGRGQFNPITLVYLLIILFVGITSFGLGRLSVNGLVPDGGDTISVTQVKDSSVITEKESMVGNYSPKINNQKTASASIQSGGKYVASKNGKMYYTATCSGAKRIKSENRVWFDTASDAQKSGYQLASSCK